MRDAEDVARAREQWLESLGAAEVRDELSSGRIPHGLEPHAIEWLARNSGEVVRLQTGSQSEHMAIARASKDAAWASAAAAERAVITADRARLMATVALVVAAISVAASLFGAWQGHREATKAVHPEVIGSIDAV